MSEPRDPRLDDSVGADAAAAAAAPDPVAAADPPVPGAAPPVPIAPAAPANPAAPAAVTGSGERVPKDGWRVRMGRGVRRLAMILIALASIAVIGSMLVDVGQAFATADDPLGTTIRTFSYKNTADAPRYDGWGLTFGGLFGMLLAAAQLAGITAGTLLAAAGWRPRVRRTAFLVVAAVIGLWAGNAIWLTIVGDAMFFGAAAVLHTAGFVSVLGLMRWRWAGRGG